MLNFVFELPAIELGSSAVLYRELSTLIEGVSSTEILPIPFDGMSAAQKIYSAPTGATVTGSLTDVDSMGNRSEPSNFTFILVPPAKPGEVHLKVIQPSVN